MGKTILKATARSSNVEVRRFDVVVNHCRRPRSFSEKTHLGKQVNEYQYRKVIVKPSPWSMVNELGSFP